MVSSILSYTSTPIVLALCSKHEENTAPWLTCQNEWYPYVDAAVYVVMCLVAVAAFVVYHTFVVAGTTGTTDASGDAKRDVDTSAALRMRSWAHPPTYHGGVNNGVNNGTIYAAESISLASSQPHMANQRHAAVRRNLDGTDL